MTRISASRDIMYSAPPAPEDEPEKAAETDVETADIDPVAADD